MIAACPPPEAFAHLVGVPYAQADCWAIVVAGLRLFGVDWPADWTEALTRETALAAAVPSGVPVRPGDVYQFERPVDGLVERHVGLVIHADRYGWQARILHGSRTAGGSRIDALAMLRKGMKIVRVVRPIELASPEASA